MPAFKEMDPDILARMIEGYKDELTPAKEERDSLYRQFSCPRCKLSLTPEFDVRTCFKEGDIVPRALLRCTNCRYLIDPHTRMVVEFGDASKIPVESSPIILR